MDDHTKDIFSQILWPDAQIERIQIDYDEVVISLTTDGVPSDRILRCKGYIGYSLLGFWDDDIVAKAELLEASDFQLSCVQTLMHRQTLMEIHGSVFVDSGNPARNRRSYYTLAIHLIDGAVLNIVAAEFAVD